MDNMELSRELNDERSESVQQGMPDNLMLNNIINSNNVEHEFFENKRKLFEVGKENNVNVDFQSHSPYKIIRHETPDLPRSKVNDPSCNLNGEEEEEDTLNRCNQSEFSSFSSSSCLNLSGNSVVVSEDDIENNYQTKSDNNGLNISGYTLMFSNEEAHDTELISATPMVTNNNGQVENIFVLSLPPGMNTVLSDQQSETEENSILITTPEIEHRLEGVNNHTLSPCTSSYSPISLSSSAQHVPTSDTAINNHSLVTNNHKDVGNRIGKSPRIETNRVKFPGEMTPRGYIFDSAVEQNLVHTSTRNPFSSLTNNHELLNHRRPNSTNSEMEKWHKRRDENKENTPTNVRNKIQGFRPLCNQIPASSYFINSNQVVMSDPIQFNHDSTCCTFATSSIGSQVSSTPCPKYDQMTFCHTGLISQPPMKKEEVKPCPSNYFQGLNANSSGNINQRTNSLLCLKSNFANIKENDEARHLHNLNERKRRARIIIACNLMRKLVPGLSDKTDRATVFEYAARYIHFLNAQVGKEYETNFLVKYSNY